MARRFWLLAALPLAAAALAAAQETSVARESGDSVFRIYCASCHGKQAKGDGPLAEHLRFRPPDLTLIEQQNEGEFPADDVAKSIDGGKPLKGHGGSEMPVWGDAFKSSHDCNTKEKVQERIEALVDYLRAVQVREKK